MYKPGPQNKKFSLEQMMSKFISTTETRLHKIKICRLKDWKSNATLVMIASRELGTLPKKHINKPKTASEGH